MSTISALSLAVAAGLFASLSPARPMTPTSAPTLALASTSTPTSAPAVLSPTPAASGASSAVPAPALAPGPAEDALKQIIEEGNPAYLDWSSDLAARDQIAKLYQANGYRLLWSDGEKPTATAILLLQELRNAAERGLDPEDYPGNRLAYLLIDLIDAPHSGIEQWALFDAGLSLASLRFLSDLHFGRVDPASLGHDLSIGRIKLDLPAALGNLATAVNVTVAVDALEPQFNHYALLKKQLSRYRELAGEDGLNDLPALPSKSLKPGDEYAGAPQLQRLLVALGDGTAPAQDAAPPQTLSPTLVDALKHFQSRHGEKPDGVLGAATYAQLTRPLAGRVNQIELTMERWRWLPSELVSAPIIVNIPQFRLFAFESTSDSEASIRQMDVIVGKSFDSTQTPVFAADMSYLIFRPYWEVPVQHRAEGNSAPPRAPIRPSSRRSRWRSSAAAATPRWSCPTPPRMSNSSPRACCVCGSARGPTIPSGS